MINPQASALVERCQSTGITVATAESLTAGLCAATIAEVPGASAVLRGGVIVYATELKETLAGVDAQLLDTEGPVSSAVAAALARGAAEGCGATLGIGITGVAGPEPQDGHPVGEVYVAVVHPGGESVRCIQDEYEDLVHKGVLNDLDPEEVRARVRSLAVDCALFDALRLTDRVH
ncbi:CinA family protein [Corynebacterium sp. 320]|uniref:CinA family protein n=1 Tax=Corynebacterium TaxID=1716 RepID=UPI00125CC9F1|nr:MULTISPECIES: CinA family protein [Corynebacterium]KAB1503771.1 CinA family protein [Corynebacterium sp. 320]KAB1553129.1 CinA family protein [Corynebacterium sp. 321]KAB1553653.1 CinA family protein [Corynebacterium sp. 319]KAB3527907.1 CinA family protein [Corynebacterium sp. 250]KAB3540604.1 CinA family protein [Corynebacterium sp. 366]